MRYRKVSQAYRRNLKNIDSNFLLVKSENKSSEKMSEVLELEPGSIVASQYGLVRHICQYLSSSSLRSCSNVNSLWAKAVDAEDKKRQILMFHWKGEAKNSQVSFP